MDIRAALTNTLSPEHAVRVQAEESLNQAFLNSAASSLLAGLCLDASNELAVRQMTGLALKRYVPLYWSPAFHTFVGPAAPYEVKQQVRKAVFAGLSDSTRAVRSVCAVVISDIAVSDWPDEWEDLVTLLLELLSSASPNSVHGALQLLTELVALAQKTNLTEDQLLPICADLLPRLLDILGDATRYSAVSRARSLSIFSQCVLTLFMVKDEYPSAVANATSDILPRWIEAINYILSASDVSQDLTSDSAWHNIAVRSEAVNAIEVVLSSFPKSIQQQLPALAHTCLAHLSSLSEPFKRIHLTEEDSAAPALEDGGSDISVDLPRFIARIIAFLDRASKKTWTKNIFVDSVSGEATDVLQHCISTIVHFGQITSEDEESWLDPNTFVAEEDDEGLAFTLRLGCSDFLTSLVDLFGRSTIRSLNIVLWQSFAVAEEQRAAGQETWWKPLESALNQTGGVAEDVLSYNQHETAAGRPLCIDIAQLFERIVHPSFSASNAPFLQGRAFVLASQYSGALPHGSATQYASAALDILRSSEAIVSVKVSAVRAIANYFRILPREEMLPLCSDATVLLLPLLSQTFEATLVLILEALEFIIRAGPDTFSTQDFVAVANSVLSAWTTQSNDPLTSAAVCDLLSAIAGLETEAARDATVTYILPTIASHIDAVRQDPESLSATSAVGLLDSTLIGLKAPYPDTAFQTFAASLVHLLETTEDRSAIQEGLDCLVQSIKKACDQVLAWHDGQQAGLIRIFAVIERMLAPEQDESAGLFVGELLLHLLKRAEHAIAPVLPNLLQSLIRRLATAQTASFCQSLIVPFAQLIHSQGEAILDYLDNMSMQALGLASPASTILMSSWTDNFNTFQGFWSLRISTIALSRLFTMNRPSLDQCIVKGDFIVSAANANTIMTRSKAKKNPEQFTQIPLPAKIMKILISELENDALTPSKNGQADNAGSDDGDEEWEEEDGGDATKDVLASFGLSGDLLDDDDLDKEAGDEEFEDDEVSKIDIKEYILQQFRTVGTQDVERWNQLASYLNDHEREVLGRCMK